MASPAIFVVPPPTEEANQLWACYQGVQDYKAGLTVDCARHGYTGALCTAYQRCYARAVGINVIKERIGEAMGSIAETVVGTGRLISSIPHIWGLLDHHARQSGYISSISGTLTLTGAKEMLQLTFDLMSALIIAIGAISLGQDVGDILESFVEPLWDTIIDNALGGLLEQYYRIKRGTEEMDPDDYSELLSFDGVNTSVGYAVTAAQTGASNLAAAGIWVRGVNTSLVDVGRQWVDRMRDVIDAIWAPYIGPYRTVVETTRRMFEDVVDLYYYAVEDLTELLDDMLKSLYKLYHRIVTKSYPAQRETDEIVNAVIYAQYVNAAVDRVMNLADTLQRDVYDNVRYPIPLNIVNKVDLNAMMSPLSQERTDKLTVLQQAFTQLKQLRNLP